MIVQRWIFSSQPIEVPGCQDFVEQATGKISPADIKNHLRIYPLAQLLISIVKYHELNKNTDIIRQTVMALLDSLDDSVHSESYEAQTLSQHALTTFQQKPLNGDLIMIDQSELQEKGYIIVPDLVPGQLLQPRYPSHYRLSGG